MKTEMFTAITTPCFWQHSIICVTLSTLFNNITGRILLKAGLSNYGEPLLSRSNVLFLPHSSTAVFRAGKYWEIQRNYSRRL